MKGHCRILGILCSIIFFFVGASHLDAVQAVNGRLRNNHDYTSFQDDDEDFRLIPTGVRIEVEALNGLPHDYAISAAKYIEQALLALENVGETPTRKYHRIKVAQMKGVLNGKKDRSNEFPYELHFERSFDVPVEFVILPEPDIVRRILPEPYFSLIHGKKLSDDDMAKSGFAVTVFTLQQEGFQNFPSPSGYMFNWYERNRDGYYITDHPSMRELFEFPRTEGADKKLGFLVNRPIDKKNSVLKFCIGKGIDSVQFWVGYSMIDANGAVRDLTVEPVELPPQIEKLKFRKGMLRPLKAPSQVQVAIEGKVNNTMLFAKDEHGSIVGVISQEWVMPAEGYADADVPIWGLHATYESKPWRESFELAPVTTQKDLGELWKVFVFPNAKPDDLINAIFAIKGIRNPNPAQCAKAADIVAPYFLDFKKARSRYLPN